MKDEGGKGKGERGKEKIALSFLLPFSSSPFHPFSSFLLFVLLCMLGLACDSDARQSGISPQAQTVIDMVTEDFNEGRYENIYTEAAEEWRQTTTLEQSNATFKRLKDRLGGIKGRVYQTAREEESTGGGLPGHSLVVKYYTTFERGEGMETFTLVERDGRWFLAKYFVNSDALK